MIILFSAHLAGGILVDKQRMCLSRRMARLDTPFIHFYLQNDLERCSQKMQQSQRSYIKTELPIKSLYVYVPRSDRAACLQLLLTYDRYRHNFKDGAECIFYFMVTESTVVYQTG